MATLTELDSGVASSEATPEGQTIIAAVAEEVAKAALANEDFLEVTKEDAEEGNDKAENGAVAINDNKTSLAALAADEDEDGDDLQDVDENLGERLMALTEMFPDSLRTAGVNAASSSINLIKSTYNLARWGVWVAVSTSIILFAPVFFEAERLNVEEMMKQDRNRLVFGPGSAMSGPPTSPGLMPPPPAL